MNITPEIAEFLKQFNNNNLKKNKYLKAKSKYIIK